MPVFIFPGQGSQRPGMGRAWIDHPSWDVVAEAAEAAGRSLDVLLLDTPADELAETRNSQLATLTLSMVVLDAVERLGIEPTAAAGHSLGEYAALVAAGALSVQEVTAVVAERGEAMQAAADDQPGTMAAIVGLDAAGVDTACRRADGDVWVAADNGPVQVTVAGEEDAVERAIAQCRRMGARRIRPLAVGGAFHTPLMASARPRLRKALREATVRAPEVPVIANVDAAFHDDPDEWRSLLSAQLCNPVRWRQTILELAGVGGDDRARHRPDGERLFVELGAGGVLPGLIRRIVPGATVVSVAEPDDLDRLVEVMAGRAPALTALSLAGEHLYMSERIVISPCAGVFTPSSGPDGGRLGVGDLLGYVAAEEVRSPFEGELMGMLAHPGERVQPGQPVAWLRAS